MKCFVFIFMFPLLTRATSPLSNLATLPGHSIQRKAVSKKRTVSSFASFLKPPFSSDALSRHSQSRLPSCLSSLYRTILPHNLVQSLYASLSLSLSLLPALSAHRPLPCHSFAFLFISADDDRAHKALQTSLNILKNKAQLTTASPVSPANDPRLPRTNSIKPLTHKLTGQLLASVQLRSELTSELSLTRPNQPPCEINTPTHHPLITHRNPNELIEMKKN